MMNTQGQQQMYMQVQQTQMGGMPATATTAPATSPSYTCNNKPSSIVQQTSMMNVKQEPQAPLSNIHRDQQHKIFPCNNNKVKQEVNGAGN